jgi:hypothetical protein
MLTREEKNYAERVSHILMFLTALLRFPHFMEIALRSSSRAGRIPISDHTTLSKELLANRDAKQYKFAFH